MVKVGEPAPDFELATDSGERVKLPDFRGKAVVLYFYPKDDTPASNYSKRSVDPNEARTDYERALELAHTEPERRFLKRRLAELSA